MWKNFYKEFDEQGLINNKPYAINPRLRTLSEIVEKIIRLRIKYHFSPEHIALYLDGIHTIKLSANSGNSELAVIGLGTYL